MNEHLRTVRLGAATISIINVGDIQGPLSGWMDEPAGGWSPADAARLKRIERFPTQCVHIALSGLSVLVDAGVYEWTPQSPNAIADDQPPPTLRDALAQLGVRPADIQHVVITHAHQDHFNGAAMTDRPCFPNARHYLGRADWERAEMQRALQDVHSVESRTLGVLYRTGLLDLVAGDRALADEVQIMAAPGETPGHQIVRVQSEGQTLYCVGDLFHHPIEAEQPSLMVRWADLQTTLHSRRALIEAARAENALISATHISGIGRLQHRTAGVSWVSA